MRVQIEVNADVRHIAAVVTLCNVFNDFYEQNPEEMRGDVVPALAELLCLLNDAPENYNHECDIELWAREAELNDTECVIRLMRNLADRMEAALSPNNATMLTVPDDVSGIWREIPKP